MDLVDRLALIIDAHTDGAVTSIKKLSLEEQAAAERTDILKAKIADLNTRMAASASGGTALQQRQLSKLNGEYQGLTATLGNVPRSASRVESALSKIGLGGIVPSGTIGAAAKVLPGLAVGAAAFGGFEFLKSGVNEYVNLADQIRHVAQAADSSAEDASKLVVVTHALGVSSDTAALGVFRLGKNIALTPQHLTDYGIAIAHTKQGNVDLTQTLFNVADAYQRTQDPARRAAIVYEAFGRAGTSMLPILNANKSVLEDIANEAKRQGRIFSQADLDKAREYQIEVRELQDSWQSLSLMAGRTLVPALSEVANVLTRVGDAVTTVAHSEFGHLIAEGFKWTNPLGIAFNALGHFFGGGPSAKDQAVAALAAQQTQAQQDALSQAALATLSGATDVIAEKQNIRDAKKTLADASASLTNAVATRNKAIRDLERIKSGSPSASASSIEAANARLTAAQARLQAAQYVGGPGVSSAQAAVLSAQNSLNRLRGQGAVDTNRLADAEDRLRRANKAVADQQAAVRAAQKKQNDASGLNAQEVLGRIRGQVKDQSGLAAANVKLAGEGASAQTIADLDKLNQQIPGTLVKVANTLKAGTIAALNKEEISLGLAQQQFADAAANPVAFTAAGIKAGKSFADGFKQGVVGGLNLTPSGIKNDILRSEYGIHAGGSPRSSAARRGLGDFSQPPITVQGDLIVTGKSARQVAREVSRDNRLRMLSSG